MATDLERLIVQMSADIKSYEREMQKASGVSARTARDIEKRFFAMNRNLDGIGKRAASSLIAPLTGIAAALSVREVAAYADAWTKAKNSLAVAGITGREQADILDRLFESAQRNATPIGSLADLFGKAAQASDNLGASNQDLLAFSDGVATALKVAGTSAGEASGALTQLGQLLGSARVQAEEFNSVNEGARPILIAVANGLDKAGGSVNKLKQLVNDGEVSGREFFQAFLKGLPSIQSMAANATQTIDQGITKVNNAFTRYIGETDASLGASQRLVQGLNALADNFNHTADIVLKVAGIIAGALVGRAIGGMIASLGLSVTALIRFTAALRAAATVGGLATALGGLSAAAGPIGLVIGGTVVGALALFSQESATASTGAQTFAAALKQVEEAGKAAATATAQVGKNQLVNTLTSGVDEGVRQIEAARDAAVDLFSTIIDNAPRRLVSPAQLDSLSDLRDRLGDGSTSAEEAKDELYRLANSNPSFQKLADQMAPLLTALANAITATQNLKAELGSLSVDSFRQDNGAAIAGYDKIVQAGKDFVADATRRANMTKGQLALEKEIAEVRKEAGAAGVTLSDQQVGDLANTRIAGDAARSAEGRKGGGSRGVKATADSRLNEDIQAVRDRTAALIAEREAIGLSAVEQEKRRVALDLEQTALADLREEARRKGATDLEVITLAPDQIAAINDVAQAYAEQQVALDKAQQAQDDFNDVSRGFAGDLLHGLREGKTATEALGDALDRVADKMLDIALDSLFNSKGGGFNLLSLFGLGKANGGVVKAATGGYVSGPGSSRSDSIPARLSDGEYVVNAAATKKNRALLEAINSGRALHLARGGFVGMSSLTVPSGSGRRQQLTFAPVTHIDARGSTMSEAQFRRIAREESQRQVPAILGRVSAQVASDRERGAALRGTG